MLPDRGGLSAHEIAEWQHRFNDAEKKRARFEIRSGLPAPHTVIFSPTMRCNYTCTGCYSRNRPIDDELSEERIDLLFSELEDAGTSICMISGGEPFLRKDLPNLMHHHPELLFIVFTNGSRMTPALARKLQASKNIIPVLSMEGTDETVSKRRGKKAVFHLLQTKKIFRDAGLFFGFSTMVTKETLPQIDETFFSRAVTAGFQIGFIMEYIPVGKDINPSLALPPEERARLRKIVLKARRENPLLLFQLPDDAENGVSCGAARRFIHIASDGGLEPCPFAHHSDSSIRNLSLEQALHSTFLNLIRETPALFKKQKLACSLVENEDLVRTLL